MQTLNNNHKDLKNKCFTESFLEPPNPIHEWKENREVVLKTILKINDGSDPAVSYHNSSSPVTTHTSLLNFLTSMCLCFYADYSDLQIIIIMYNVCIMSLSNSYSIKCIPMF